MKGGSFNIFRDEYGNYIYKKGNNVGESEINIIRALFEPLYGNMMNQMNANNIYTYILGDLFANKNGNIKDLSLIVHNFQNQWNEKSNFVDIFRKLHPMHRENVMRAVVIKYVLRTEDLIKNTKELTDTSNVVSHNHQQEIKTAEKQYYYLNIYDNQMRRPNDIPSNLDKVLYNEARKMNPQFKSFEEHLEMLKKPSLIKEKPKIPTNSEFPVLSPSSKEKTVHFKDNTPKRDGDDYS